MCCFSGPVKSVSDTNIFARLGGAGETERQFLVYSMTVDMANPLAMVLPLPVKNGSTETSVHFINLEKYRDFFIHLDAGFPRPVSHSDGLSPPPAAAPATEILRVVQVGNFEASFVPTVRDFNRLDGRFQLPAQLFDTMPEYKRFGFAVFKLKPGAQTVHPMAFDFPTALEGKLFFPTVHIHDGKVHARADFDHILYCQPGGVGLKLSEWTESPKHAGSFVNVKKTAGIVLADEHCYKLEMHGMLPNRDTYVIAG